MFDINYVGFDFIFELEDRFFFYQVFVGVIIYLLVIFVSMVIFALIVGAVLQFFVEIIVYFVFMAMIVFGIGIWL